MTSPTSLNLSRVSPCSRGLPPGSKGLPLVPTWAGQGPLAPGSALGEILGRQGGTHSLSMKSCFNEPSLTESFSFYAKIQFSDHATFGFFEPCSQQSWKGGTTSRKFFAPPKADGSICVIPQMRSHTKNSRDGAMKQFWGCSKLRTVETPSTSGVLDIYTFIM